MVFTPLFLIITLEIMLASCNAISHAETKTVQSRSPVIFAQFRMPSTAVTRWLYLAWSNALIDSTKGLFMKEATLSFYPC